MIAEFGSGYRRKKPARGCDSTTGVPRSAGSNLAKSNEPLCRPPAPADSANRRVSQFHPSSCTAVSILVQRRPVISAVSLSGCARSDYRYFILVRGPRGSLDGFLSREQGRRRLPLKLFNENPEQFGIETTLKTPNPVKPRSTLQRSVDSSY